MDSSVKEAIAKWPNVPAVYGWLSLDERGRWHIHDDGEATHGGPGAPITSPQILAFIGRNYESDKQGQWFFQNGPQRVFVRLDAAPLILRVSDNNNALITHTQEPVLRIDSWWLDELGNLYAQTDKGPGRVDNRDLERVFDSLDREPHRECLLDSIESLLADDTISHCLVSHTHYPLPVPLYLRTHADHVATALGFVANPLPPSR